MLNSKNCFILGFVLTLIFSAIGLTSDAQTKTEAVDRQIIIIRHGEKPLKGDNLTCQGLNRSLALPAVLTTKFGVPDYVYVPTMVGDSATKHARIFETVIPLVSRYNLAVNSQFAEWDSTGLTKDIKLKKGTILVVWEHKLISSIVRSLGITNFSQDWGDNDYDSIWILRITNSGTTISYDKEAIRPGNQCP